MTDTDLTTHTDVPEPMPPGVPDGCQGDVWTLSYGLGLLALAVVFAHLNSLWAETAAKHGADLSAGRKGADLAEDALGDPRVQATIDAFAGALTAIGNGTRIDEAVYGIARAANKGGVYPPDGDSMGKLLSHLMDKGPESINSIAARLFPEGVMLGGRKVTARELADSLITVAKLKGTLSPEYADELDPEPLPPVDDATEDVGTDPEVA